MDQKQNSQKSAKFVDMWILLGFCHHPFHCGKRFCVIFTLIKCGESSREWKMRTNTPRGPTSGPKRAKNGWNCQNLVFFLFCSHPIHSGKKFVLFLHWSNAERIVENERRERKTRTKIPRGPTRVPKGPKMSKIAQILYFSYFAPIQFTLAKNCHCFYTDLI